MPIKLPHIIRRYVESSNRHDVRSILSCFSDDAVVHDEAKDFCGKRMIEAWVVATIENYKFQFNPLSIKHDPAEIVLALEVSGTFDGSPVTLDYHFAIEKDKIVSLAID
jgi:ketosteroid isomerase-like protein